MAAGDEGEEYGFDRGSKRSYELEVGDPLGTLRSIFVQQVFCQSHHAELCCYLALLNGNVVSDRSLQIF